MLIDNLLFVWQFILCSVNSKPFVVPELKQWTGKDGNFTPGTNAKIVCTSANPELLRIAQMFADDYQQMFGKTLSVTQAKPHPETSSYHCQLTKSWEKRVMKSRLPIGSRLLLPPRQALLEHTYPLANSRTKPGALIS